MTKMLNKFLFDHLDRSTHYVTAEAAVTEYYRIFIRDRFNKVLGYDEKTDGFVALQHRHQPMALIDELPTVAILKDKGHAVILLDESGEGRHSDCLIDGVISELKCVKTLSYSSVKKHFQKAYKQGATRIVIHIVAQTERETLMVILKRVACNDLANQINDVFLIFENELEKHKLNDFK